jgi:group I intron endonuclease
MDLKSGIYIIKNCIDDRCYVGSATSLKDRQRHHLLKLKDGSHRNVHLLRFVVKYGVDKIFFEILERCEPEKLLEREQYYIDTLNPVFNIQRVAGSNLGIVFGDEVRKRMSESKKGLKKAPCSAEGRANLSKSHIGKKQSAETIRKRVLSKQGYRHSEETKVKISAQKGWTHTEEVKKLLSELRIGKKTSEETKLKISQALKGKAKTIKDVDIWL